MNQRLEESWVSNTESAARAAPFDNTQAFSNGSRLLTDALAGRYIEIPPIGGTIALGMLPPQEMQVRAALIEASYSFASLAKVGFWGKLFGTETAQEAETLWRSKMQALATCIRSSREHRAAAIRLKNSYPGTIRGLIVQAEQIND